MALPTKIGSQLVTGVVMAVVGAGMALLFSSAGDRVAAERDREMIQDMKTRLDFLYQNGSPVINNRVTNLETGYTRLEKKIDDIYGVVVLRRAPGQ